MTGHGRSEPDENAMRTSVIGKPNVLSSNSVIPDGRDPPSDGRGCALHSPLVLHPDFGGSLTSLLAQLGLG